MLYKTTQQRINSLLALAGVVMLSACGGSSTSSDIVDTGTATTPMHLSGTIVVEERNGKTVFDSWFVQEIASEVVPTMSAAISTNDECQVSSVNINSLETSQNVQASNSWDNLQSINGGVEIESRVGQFDSLVKQTVAGTSVYASEARWQSDAVPEDAVVSVPDESLFGGMGNASVSPLLPLVWLAPNTGVMASAATKLQWEASNQDEVRIKLKLSAIDFRDSQNPIVSSIDCNLIDDGDFTLSAELQQQLPDDHSGIVVYAVRERVQQILNDASSLTVVQLSYPAPL